MDVCLGQFGQCNFISAKHAFIFYDEVRSSAVAVGDKQIVCSSNGISIEARCKKICLRGCRPGLTQTELYKHKR